MNEKNLGIRGWRTGFLKNVILDIGDGGTPPRNDPANFGGEIPWTVVEDIKPEIWFTKETLSQKGFRKCNAKLWPPDSIVLSFGATIGEVGLAKVALTTKQGLAGIVADPRVVDPRYLYFLLSTKKSELLRYANGTTIKEVRPSVIREYIGVSFPQDIAEQREVSIILATLNEAVEKSEALVSKLTRIKQGLIQDLLTRGIDESGDIRSEKMHKFKISPIGRIPEEWEAQRLDCLANAIDPQPSHRAPKEDRDGYPYLGVGDFKEDGSADFASCRKVPLEAVRRQKNRFDIEMGDILFGKIGTIGAPRLLPSNQYYALNANTILIKPRETNSYVFWVLSSFYLEAEVNQQVHTTSQPAFGIKKVRAMLIPVPHREDERRQIAQRLDSIQEMITNELVFKRKLERLKKGLMEDLLSGKVRVSALLRK
jgi:type I restriction enzyme S subunit